MEGALGFHLSSLAPGSALVTMIVTNGTSLLHSSCGSQSPSPDAGLPEPTVTCVEVWTGVGPSWGEERPGDWFTVTQQ